MVFQSFSEPEKQAHGLRIGEKSMGFRRKLEGCRLRNAHHGEGAYPPCHTSSGAAGALPPVAQESQVTRATLSSGLVSREWLYCPTIGRTSGPLTRATTGGTSHDGQAATSYRRSDRASRAIISSSEGMSNSEIELTFFSLLRTNLDGLNSLNRMS